MTQFDIIIIGGGPNGLSAAYELGRVFPEKRIRILEKKSILNHLRQYPDVLWHSRMKELKLPSYLNRGIDDGYNPVSSELVRYYSHFAREHDLDILENCAVLDIKLSGGIYHLEVIRDGQTKTVTAGTILLCTGIYENHRKLPIKSDYDYCSHRFDLETSGKNLLLVGGGNSASDFIIHLLGKNRITWVMRSPSWSIVNDVLLKKFTDAISNHSGNLTVHTNTEVIRLEADHSATLSNGLRVRNIDACTMLLGYNSRNPLFERMGLEFDHECLKLNEWHETSLPNVYAFGSVMARWSGNAPDPTFIHNGNLKQLNTIIDHLIEKEVTGMMPSIHRISSSGKMAIDPSVRPGILSSFRKSVRRVLSP